MEPVFFALPPNSVKICATFSLVRYDIFFYLFYFNFVKIQAAKVGKYFLFPPDYLEKFRNLCLTVNFRGTKLRCLRHYPKKFYLSHSCYSSIFPKIQPERDM